MTWSVGTPFVDGTKWMCLIGIMRYEASVTIHFGIFWIGLAWD
jgi:hypothetical protein